MTTYAIDSMDLGATDWQTLGYDLDHKVTTKDSVDVCVQSAGAPLTNQADGDDGIDNAFGKLLAPWLPTIDMTTPIRAGRFTLQIQVVDLDGTMTEACVGLPSQVFTSDVYDASGGTPAFDETTNWPVMSESVTDGTSIASGAKSAFTDAYVTNGTFVAGANGGVTVPLRLVFGDNAMTLLVHDAIISFDIASASDVQHGLLAGVLDPFETIKAFEAGIPPSQSCCATDCGVGIEGQFLQTADILADRTNARGVSCNAISFAIGFTAKRVANPMTVAAPLPAPPPPCP